MKKTIRDLSIGAFALAMVSQAQVSTPIKWACIGNSITAGPTGVTNGSPARLGTRLLMDTVQNDGVGYRTLMRSGDSTYWKYGKLPQVFAFQPDIISIMLGTNDSKPLNWKDSANFVKDYEDLIDTLSAMPSHPRIFLIYPTPVFNKESGAPYPDTSTVIRESIIRNSIIPRIRQVALAKGVDTIDLQTPFLTRGPGSSLDLFGSDSIHPTTPGSDSIAAYIFRAYVSKVTRIAVVGNSITEYINSGIMGAVAKDAYTIKLNMLLGRNYYAENEGRSGCYMQKPGTITPAIMSYWTQSNGKFQAAFALNPGIITIMLGTNDSRMKSWNTARYITDYKAMIDTFSNNITPKPQIWLVRPMPAWRINGHWNYGNPTTDTTNGINGDIIRDSVIPAILQIAADKGLPTIDLYNSAFNSPTEPTAITNKDGVHPNKAGSDTIAHVFFRALNLPPTAIYSHQPDASRVSHEGLYLNPSSKPAPSGLLEGSRIYSLDGKSVPDGSPLPAGAYVVKPVDVKPDAKNGGKKPAGN